MLAASCSRTDKLYWLADALESMVLGWTAEPSSSPGKPGIPAPEFCALGIGMFASLVRAVAGSAVIVSASRIALMFFIFFIVPTSIVAFPYPANVRSSSAFQTYTNLT
jgi:hypothetical protein